MLFIDVCGLIAEVLNVINLVIIFVITKLATFQQLTTGLKPSTANIIP